MNSCVINSINLKSSNMVKLLYLFINLLYSIIYRINLFEYNMCHIHTIIIVLYIVNIYKNYDINVLIAKHF